MRVRSAIYNAKQAGVSVRGPAQDPIVITKEEDKVIMSALLSNDESLGRGGKFLIDGLILLMTQNGLLCSGSG